MSSHRDSEEVAARRRDEGVADDRTESGLSQGHVLQAAQVDARRPHPLIVTSFRAGVFAPFSFTKMEGRGWKRNMMKAAAVSLVLACMAVSYGCYWSGRKTMVGARRISALQTRLRDSPRKLLTRRSSAVHLLENNLRAQKMAKVLAQTFIRTLESRLESA